MLPSHPAGLRRCCRAVGGPLLSQLPVKCMLTTAYRDAQYLDMKAALVAFLWGSGQRAAAEGEWESLQQSQGEGGLCCASDDKGLGARAFSRA
jgi:hypothetical protein